MNELKGKDNERKTILFPSISQFFLFSFCFLPQRHFSFHGMFCFSLVLFKLLLKI
jgi:hypothetical protein